VIRRIVLSLAALLTGFILVWLALLAMNITVHLDVLRDPIEAAASRALGRQIRVLGFRTSPARVMRFQEFKLRSTSGELEKQSTVPISGQTRF